MNLFYFLQNLVEKIQKKCGPNTNYFENKEA